MNKSLLLFPATASVVPLLVGGSIGATEVGSIVSRIISENLFKVSWLVRK